MTAHNYEGRNRTFSPLSECLVNSLNFQSSFGRGESQCKVHATLPFVSPLPYPCVIAKLDYRAVVHYSKTSTQLHTGILCKPISA